MQEPVYILIRTSRRPQFFSRMMRSVKEQTYKNIVTIVHSDDPRDEYAAGDIIVRGHVYGREIGNGTYNLYNNRLLDAIPNKKGWIHFIDDDDEYSAPDVIEKFVAASKKDYINVARVKRWKDKIFPNRWLEQKSFQTECFMIHTDYKDSARWWPHLGGDHDYSKKLTKILPINWIENLLVCNAQEGKGHGRRLDVNGEFAARESLYPSDKKVCIFCLQPNKVGRQKDWLKQGTFKNVKYSEAIEYEKKGIAKITFKDVTIIKKQGDSYGTV